MLQWLCESSNFATLEDLNMSHALNFQEKEACELLAQFIDTAPSLKKLNIIQSGEDTLKVGVLIEHAVEADPKDESVVAKQGLIRVVDICK